MDSLIFQAMAIELNRKIAGSRLDKVVQTSSGTLVLKLWTGQEKVQLLLKAEGQGCFYLTRKSYPAPAKPPRICQLLRARLRRLVEVRAEPLDRLVHFHFIGPEQTRYDLVLEAFGPQGNLILVDHEGRIVDLLYRREGQRKLLPGEPYSLPEQRERIHLFAESRTVAQAMQKAEEKGDHTFAGFAPMSPALANEIMSARQTGQSFAAILTRIRDVFDSGVFEARKVAWDKHSGLLPLMLVPEVGAVEEYEDLSAMLEASLEEQDSETTKDLTARMAALLKKQRSRLEKRKEHIAAESERQANPERFKMLGELLLANFNRFRRGDEAVEVEDYYQSPPSVISVALDPKATPQENAEHYFKLYRKAKRSREHHARRLQETAEEIEWLDQVALSLEEAETGEDLYQVQLELESAGILKQAKGQLGKRKEPKPEDQLYRATTPAGWQLYWGKSSRTNDYVSRTMTGAQDFWFHAKGMPGSHLVLKCGDSPDKVVEEDVLFAASIAAGYSKGKNDSKVEVIVACGRDVKKPKGAKPGLVTVDSYRSVIVEPRRLDV